MRFSKTFLLFALVFHSTLSCASAASPEIQNREKCLKAFSEYRLGVMMHFNIGTFSNKEWSLGNESPELFNPAKLDCGQWAKACKAAGVRYAVLTTKHHDGFCLWDSKTTKHDVASSPFKRDVVREYVDAFRKEGIVPCLYFSIWDRNAKVSEGDFTPEKQQLVLDQLTELLTNYGPVPVLLIDGWCWRPGGYNKIPYPLIREHIRKIQPNCLVSDHTHVQSPWSVDMIYFEGPMGEFPSKENTYASQLGLTCQNGWFWHPGSEKKLTMTSDSIVEKLKLCEARNCNYMVNIGPNRDGLYDDNVVQLLTEIGKKWKPDLKRSPLPAQPRPQLHPYAPAAVTADGFDVPHLTDGMSGGADFNTFWVSSKIPTRIVLDLGKPLRVGTLNVLPQQFPGKAGQQRRSMNPDEQGYAPAPEVLGDIASGRITRYKVLTGVSKDALKEVSAGEFPDTKDAQVIEFPAVSARYVVLEILATRGGKHAAIDEISAGAPN